MGAVIGRLARIASLARLRAPQACPLLWAPRDEIAPTLVVVVLDGGDRDRGVVRATTRGGATRTDRCALCGAPERHRSRARRAQRPRRLCYLGTDSFAAGAWRPADPIRDREWRARIRRSRMGMGRPPLIRASRHDVRASPALS